MKTLSYLTEEEYPPALIFIFVADEGERRKYEATLPPSSYNSLIVGKKGLKEQRKVISEWAEEGEIIVQMDDDVSGIKFLDPQASFRSLVLRGVKEIKEGKGGLFGVLPNDDTRRFKDSSTYHLAHILGSFFICRNLRALETTTNQKEDYERSILYFLKGKGVIRYRGAGVSTRYNVGEGGLIAPDRAERMKEEVEALSERYPLLCEAIEKKGCPDLKMNWRALRAYSPSEDEGVPHAPQP